MNQPRCLFGRTASSLASAAAGFALLAAATPANADTSGAAKKQKGAIEGNMTLACQFRGSTHQAVTLKTVKGDVPPKKSKKRKKVDFRMLVVDGKLVIVAKDGGQKLHLLSRNPGSGAMFFAEPTPSGNIALWSFYPVKRGRVLFMKQNNYTVLGVHKGVEVWNHAGRCAVTGGNGVPLSD